MHTTTNRDEITNLATAVLDTATEASFETILIRTSAGFFRPQVRVERGICFGPTGYAFGWNERYLSLGYVVPSPKGPLIATNVEFPVRHRKLFLLENVDTFLVYLARSTRDDSALEYRTSLVKGSLRQLLPAGHQFK